MSLFDFPRVHIKGTISFNPATGNNDDYANSAKLPKDWGPFAGQPLALMDSKHVKARTYGMSDDAFKAWVQKAQPFDQNGETTQIVPAEWNYYGGLDNTISAKVIGVQTAANQINTACTENVPLSELIGADLSFNGTGHFADVNSQGSPPATQFFIDNLSIKNGGTTYLSGAASKAASLWLNFYRNVNLTADGGAGGYAYHVIKKEGNNINIPGFEDSAIVGVIFRYYLYRALIGTQSNEGLEAIYKKGETNPANLEIVGTFAPLYATDTINSMPTGRLLVSNTANIPTPPGMNNNSGPSRIISLAPGVIQQKGNIISADFSGTFPDNYQHGLNDKFDFGEVFLHVTNGTEATIIGRVPYSNTEAGDSKGWMFDFDISKNTKAQSILQDGNASFQLLSPKLGIILKETDYYFVSNQLAIYAEQHGTGAAFRNQGTIEPATISVYHRGKELSAEGCPPITVWQYRSIPLEAPGMAKAINNNFKPGQPIEVDTSQPGNFLLTFSINPVDNPPPAGYPPASYLNFMNPPSITNAPSISLRILPNEEDFSQYYENPNAAEPVGNASLTFDIVYDKVLRTYYLLYPVMNQYVVLNSEKSVADNAQAMISATDPANWMSTHFMPRTRDLSESRRNLLQAWCRKKLKKEKKLKK